MLSSGLSDFLQPRSRQILSRLDLSTYKVLEESFVHLHFRRVFGDFNIRFYRFVFLGTQDLVIGVLEAIRISLFQFRDLKSSSSIKRTPKYDIVLGLASLLGLLSSPAAISSNLGVSGL
ncbi:19869_t:CDS:2 [Dentiscutata erythropus]|uniref:19869_t:CDS:1 n=1 Tax=Dentiscutata erythropus TaxID=1348616 RepID=A0A9N9NG53_9GLOM|nr:19869_t:CDS:2 [Dentiscutata erythropus]